MISVYIVWGSTYLAIRFAVATMPPFLMAGVRFVIAGAILYAWMRLRGTPAPTRMQWRATAIVVVPTMNSFVILTPLVIQYFTFGTVLHSLQYLGVLVVIAGVVRMTTGSSGSD